MFVAAMYFWVLSGVAFGLENGQNAAIIISPSSFPGVGEDGLPEYDFDTCVDLDVAAITNQCEYHRYEVKVIGRKIGERTSVDSNQLDAALEAIRRDWNGVRGGHLIVYYSGHGFPGGLYLKGSGPFWRRLKWYAPLERWIRNNLHFNEYTFILDACFSGSFSITRASFAAAARWYQFAYTRCEIEETTKLTYCYGGDFTRWLSDEFIHGRDWGNVGEDELIRRFNVFTNQEAAIAERSGLIRRQTPVIRISAAQRHAMEAFMRNRAGKSASGFISTGKKRRLLPLSKRPKLALNERDLESMSLEEKHVEKLERVLRFIDELSLGALPAREFGDLTFSMTVDIVNGMSESDILNRYCESSMNRRRRRHRRPRWT